MELLSPKAPQEKHRKENFRLSCHAHIGGRSCELSLVNFSDNPDFPVKVSDIFLKNGRHFFPLPIAL
jgi:hypothetical protein